VRIVFFGTPEIAIPALAESARRHKVTGLVCQPDRPKGRSKRPVPPPTKVWALEHRIEAVQPEKLNDGAFENWLRSQQPDICVIVAYGRILKQRVLDVPSRGFVNMHPSLLPRWRGPSPIQAALLHGDEVTGVTIMRVTQDVDAGDVLLQEEEPIGPDDNAMTLASRLGDKGAALLIEGLELIERGVAVWRPQDDSKAVYCKLMRKEDGRIRWGKPAREIHNLVRAAVSWPVAHCLFRGEVCRIHKTSLAENTRAGIPGEVVGVSDAAVLVAAGEGAVAVEVIQMPGKRPMRIGEYMHGSPVRDGEVFKDI
jgi:methionyl-tRNA formyltransferase